jgi:hypothetical protein
MAKSKFIITFMIYWVNDSDFFKKINGLKEQVKANKPGQYKNHGKHFKLFFSRKIILIL